MVDTRRTQADLLANLLQDGQGAGSITANDIRDLLVSLSPPFGGLYVSSSAATTIATPGTFVKAAGTTTSTNLRNFTMPANNRLTYTGVPDTHVHAACSVSMTMTGTNDDISIAIAKNGTPIEHSKLTRKVGTGTDQGSTALHADVIMSTNDFIEVFLTNEDAATDITLTFGYLFIVGMIATG